MTTDEEGLKLRFRAGRFEQHLITLVLILQVTLVAMACFVFAWFVNMTIGAYYHPNRSTLIYAEWMLYPIGAVVAIYLLNLLYE